MATRGARAARIASPKAKRVVLTGEVAVSDEYGRVRLLIFASGLDGRQDPTWASLVTEVPRRHASYDVPYEASDGLDGLLGTVWVAVPAHRRQHWLAEAAALRGRRVRIETTVRPYAFDTARGARREGASLDLALMEPL